MNVGDDVAGWELVERLGGGGNAEVWLSRRGGSEVALKILKTRRADSEPYARFRTEIQVLSTHSDDPGVLPILDFGLPSRPSRRDPAWIAMPPATLVRKAIEGLTFREIVEAVAAFAFTLSRLAEHGVAHRDIKPENLYRYDGRWVVGDFGLARLPQESERRFTGSRLGPFGYMPDEMFLDAMNADPFPVDVFQLAKCLLVLASGLSDPPQGHVPAGSSGAISRYVAESRVAGLDQLVDRSSRREPENRPSMPEFARELQLWLDYQPPAGEPDVSDVIAEFRIRHKDALEARDMREQWSGRLSAVVRQLESTTLRWVEHVFGEAGLNPQVRYYHDLHHWVERSRFMGSTPELSADQRWVVGEFGDPSWPTHLVVGIGVDVDQQGEFWITACGAWGDLESTATRRWTREDVTAPIESIGLDRILEELDVDVKEMVGEILGELARGNR